MNGDAREVGLDQLGKLAEERLKAGQQVRLTVVGNSMYPLFRSKCDSVVLAPISGDIKKNDVVLYRRKNGQYVMHRIIQRKHGVYAANGDNQAWVEKPLYREQLLGRMIAFVRNGKYVTVNRFWYRVYRFVWTKGKPFRRTMIRLLQRAAKMRAWVRKSEK